MPSDEVETTARQLRLVVGELVRLIKAEPSAARLPPPQVAALGWLDREGAKTTAELAALQRIRHQSAARVVNQLADQRLATLTPHPTDGRKLLVTITASGRKALTRQREQRAELLAELITARLSAAEQRTLAKATGLLARLIEG